MLSIAVMIAGAGILIRSLYVDLNAPKDLSGNAVDFAPGTTPDPSTVDQMQVQESTERFKVPTVSLDVPLASLLEVNNTITPPGFTQAYWVRNRGVAPVDAANGTVYVVSHSVAKGLAPGNYLFDVASGTSTVKAGDEIDVSNVKYIAQSWKTISKDQLANESDLWTNEPGRLVLVTCLEEPDGSSPNNMVIIANIAA